MYNNNYHTERTYKRRRIIIDLAKLPCSAPFEVMTYDKITGEELSVFQSYDLDEARAAYEKMLTRFQDAPPKPERPLTGKYKALSDALRAAVQAGRAAQEADPEDGGTCNFDAPALSLPGWNGNLVKRAAQEAGTGCFVWTLYRSKFFVFSPRTGAQGNARTRNAEAMCAALKAAGYDASMYYQMD